MSTCQRELHEERQEQFKLLKEAAEAVLIWFDAEDKGLGSFHDRMDLCHYAEWATRTALGQDMGAFKGVPRLVLTIDPGKGD